MPIEFLNGRPLGPDELETIRREIKSLDWIDAISDDVRELIESEWPDLAAKLAPGSSPDATE